AILNSPPVIRSFLQAAYSRCTCGRMFDGCLLRLSPYDFAARFKKNGRCSGRFSYSSTEVLY
ncbi:MAG: hypothetical protein KJN72_11150, partial [Woeseia sp.]|nr:hypothetical protein [Woeseia sp.]